MIDKRKLFGSILGTVMFIVVVLALTYAMYVWRSEDTEVVFSINDEYFSCESVESKSYSIGDNTSSNGRGSTYWTFDVDNIGDGTTSTTFSITLTIGENTSTSLLSEYLKYEVLVDTADKEDGYCLEDGNNCTTVIEGNFKDKVIGVNDLGQTSIPKSVRYKYYLFIYVDEEAGNTNALLNSSMDFSLGVCKVVAFLKYNSPCTFTPSFVELVDSSTDEDDLIDYSNVLALATPTRSGITISYNSNGATSTPSSVTPSVPTFGGWYLDEALTSDNKIDASKTVSSTAIVNHNLYAKWSSGGSATLPTVTKTGYTFNGWYNGSTKVGDAEASFNPYTNYCDNLSLTASWTANTYNITLNKNGGTADGTTAIYQKYGTGIYLDSDLSKAMTGSANAIIKPTKTYTVTYNANSQGATYTGSPPSSSATFNGFYTATSGGTQMITADGYINTTNFTNTKYTAAATLYARWTNTSITLPTITKTGYTCKWAEGSTSGTQYAGGTSRTISANTTYYAVCEDSQSPVSSISSTDTMKSTEQTLTLSCTDNVGVTSYYWGTAEPSSSSTYTTITSTTNMSVTKTVNSADTYYLACKDAAGNVSETANKDIYSYTVYNMLLNVTGDVDGNYNTSNYTTASSNTYIAPKGTVTEAASIYTIPTGANASTYLGMSVGVPTTSGTATNNGTEYSHLLGSDNISLALWFERIEYTITAKATTGGTNKVTNQRGTSVTATSSSNKTLSVRYGESITAIATASTGYSFNAWSDLSTSSTTPLTVTPNKASTLTANFKANDLNFSDQSINKTYSTSSQTASITAASNGTGTYTYSEKSEKNSSGTATSYISISGTTITLAAKTPAGTYTYVITATDSGSGATVDATYTIIVGKAANSIAVTTPQTWSATFSTSAQTKTITAATGGQGTVSYAIQSQKNSSSTTVSYFTISGTTLTMKASTPVSGSSYTVVIRATAAGNTNYNSGYKDITMTVTVGKQQVNAPTSVAVSTAGIVTWIASSNATGYQISIDNSTWETATSGVDYLSDIIAATGSRTVYVRGVNSDTTNYTTSSSNATKAVTVYKVTFQSNSTTMGTVDVSSYNVISGATVSASSNKLTIKGITSGTTTKDLKTVTATAKTGYSFDSWSKTSGSITAATTITATFKDTTAPTQSITSTNTMKATSQTATLTCTDNVGVTAYYWGRDETPADTDFISVTSTKEFSITKTVNASDYTETTDIDIYFYCRDAAGNTLSTYSIEETYIYYDVYTIKNMLLKTDGTKGTYNSTNYDEISSYTYINYGFGDYPYDSDVYTIPTGASVDTYKGYSDALDVSNLSGPGDQLVMPFSYGMKFYMWFDRIEYTISYDGNCRDSTNVPSSQTKRYGVSLILSDTVPYCSSESVFLGWSTSSDAKSPTFNSYEIYSINSDATLYAIWGNDPYGFAPYLTYGVGRYFGSGYTFDSSTAQFTLTDTILDSEFSDYDLTVTDFYNTYPYVCADNHGQLADVGQTTCSLLFKVRRAEGSDGLYYEGDYIFANAQITFFPSVSTGAFSRYFGMSYTIDESTKEFTLENYIEYNEFGSLTISNFYGSRPYVCADDNGDTGDMMADVCNNMFKITACASSSCDGSNYIGYYLGD